MPVHFHLGHVCRIQLTFGRPQFEFLNHLPGPVSVQRICPALDTENQIICLNIQGQRNLRLIRLLCLASGLLTGQMRFGSLTHPFHDPGCRLQVRIIQRQFHDVPHTHPDYRFLLHLLLPIRHLLRHLSDH